MRKFLVMLASISFIFTTAGPNSGGTFSDDASIGSFAWSNTSNVASSNNVYATITLDDAEQSHYIKVTNFGFSLPSATIDGIAAEVEINNPDGAGEDLSERIVKGGTISGNDPGFTTLGGSFITDTYISYGGASDLWGLSLSYTDVNASNFGFVFSIQGTDFSSVYSVDHIRLTVYYTESGSTVKRRAIGMAGQSPVCQQFINGTWVNKGESK